MEAFIVRSVARYARASSGNTEADALDALVFLRKEE